MAAERLTRAAVADEALALGDEHGLEAVTIRRLAQELGVTPMALYWHFKTKDELLVGVVDHALAEVRRQPGLDDPWPQLRHMVETLVAVLREHPVLPDLLHACDKEGAVSFLRATEDALSVLEQLGFTVEEGYWIAGYLLNGAIGLVAAQPDCRLPEPGAEAGEWRRQRRLELERLPPADFPRLTAFARTYEGDPDLDRYYRFGVELLLAGVAARRPG